MIKKINKCFLLVCLSYVGVSFAANNQQDAVIHLSKLSLAYSGPIVAEYVTCQSGPPCGNPMKYSVVIAEDGDESLQFSGIDMFLVSLKTQDGKYIWGPKVAEYARNACTTQNGSNAFRFELNSNNSITCIQGMD